MIDDAGQQLGIMPPQQAITIARQKGLDLVEVAPTAVPPVCRIMDFGKYQYQEQKRTREARKHQKVIEVKEIKFRPKVDDHDFEFKKHHVERFLTDGDKVKAVVFFRGREIAHPEIGRRIIERLITELGDLVLVESAPRLEGNQLHTILTRRAVPGGKPPSRPPAPPAQTLESLSRPTAPPPPTTESPVTPGEGGPATGEGAPAAAQAAPAATQAAPLTGQAAPVTDEGGPATNEGGPATGA